MPTYLSPAARTQWRKLLPLLMERGSLTAADAQQLSMHCELFARWVTAQTQITAEGITQTVTVLDSQGEQVTRTRPHIALKILQDCEKSLRASLRELGLTPASREKVKPARTIENESEDLLAGLDAIKKGLENLKL
jgi:P27 family predicted phage terminase small subunit